MVYEQWPSFPEQCFADGSLALFEAAPQVNRTTIALRVNGEEFLEWRDHLQAMLKVPISVVDHDLSWSIYFTDLDANPFEITSYEYEWLRSRLDDRPKA